MMPFWSTRTKQDAARYWETRAVGYRGLLVSMLKPLPPFRSVLEIGAHSGPNLWAIRQQFPDVHLIGLEPSAACATFGQIAAVKEAMDRMTPRERLAFDQRAQDSGEIPSVGVDLLVGKAPEGLAVFHDIDVVVTCYTLAYLSPADLATTLREIKRIAKVGCLLVEPMPGPGGPAGPIVGAKVPASRHDYASAFAAGDEWDVELRPFIGPQGLDGVLRARRRGVECAE